MRVRSPFRLPTLVIVVTSAVACGCGAGPPSPADDAAWRGTIETEGGVTTVVNESGSVWGGTARLVEEASIGVESGADEYMLGQVASVHATDDRIYVADPQIPAVRMYDLQGTYVGDLGAQGQGPGEYQRPMIVGSLEDGRLFVFDRGAMRYNIHSAAGEPLATWPASHAHCCDLRFIGGPGDTIWGVLRDPEQRSGPIRTGIQAYGPDGPQGPPRWPDEIAYTPLTYRQGGEDVEGVPFRPEFTWSVTAEGNIVAGASDRYRFEIQRADGSRLVVERSWEPIPIPEERVEYARRRQVALVREYEEAGWDWDGAEIPHHQPAFRSFVPALSGELWVLRRGDSVRLDGCAEDPLAASFDEVRGSPCWTDEWILDVFGPDGRYLGEVEAPGDLLPFELFMLIRGEVVVGVTQDAAGILRVKRYRMVLPGAQDGVGTNGTSQASCGPPPVRDNR